MQADSQAARERRRQLLGAEWHVALARLDLASAGRHIAAGRLWQARMRFRLAIDALAYVVGVIAP